MKYKMSKLESATVVMTFFVFFNFLFITNVHAAGDFCFYFKGGIGEQCAVFNSATQGPDKNTIADCNAYAEELKSGEVYPLNLVGVGELTSGSSCLDIAIPSKKPEDPQVKFVVIKVAHGLQSINFSGGIGILEVNTDKMADTASILGQKGDFADALKLVGVQNVVDEEDSKIKFSQLLTSFLNDKSNNFCCLSHYSEYSSCAAPKPDASKIEDITLDFYESIKKQGFKFEAQQVYDNVFLKSISAADGKLIKKKLLGGTDSYNLYRCSGEGFNALNKYDLYPVSCADTNDPFITPVDQEGKSVPKSGTMAAWCSLKPSPAPTQYEGEDFLVPKEVKDLNKIGTLDPKVLLGRFIRAATGIMGSIALAMLVYGGILFMISAGNSERTEKGRSVLVWSSLGLIVILTSYALVNLILTTF